MTSTTIALYETTKMVADPDSPEGDYLTFDNDAGSEFVAQEREPSMVLELAPGVEHAYNDEGMHVVVLPNGEAFSEQDMFWRRRLADRRIGAIRPIRPDDEPRHSRYRETLEAGREHYRQHGW